MGIIKEIVEQQPAGEKKPSSDWPIEMHWVNKILLPSS